MQQSSVVDHDLSLEAALDLNPGTTYRKENRYNNNQFNIKLLKFSTCPYPAYAPDIISCPLSVLHKWLRNLFIIPLCFPTVST
jgi:hypothetical protein